VDNLAEKRKLIFFGGLIGLAALLFSATAWSQGLPLITSQERGAQTVYTVPIQTLLTLTALSFLPAALMLMTSFTRILIVFALLRQALGLQGVPPNTVLVGLALFLTFFIMTPVLDQVYQQAYLPLSRGEIEFEKALSVGVEPFRAFMLANTRQDELTLFANLFGQPIPAREETPLQVLVPAFAMSEIKTGFLIGYLIYLPFLAIDFAVASVLTSLGMIMVSPMMFSLPLKLVIFVLADGWTLLGTSLVAGFPPVTIPTPVPAAAPTG
jgi:flagellar biosynthetic protein FliP